MSKQNLTANELLSLKSLLNKFENQKDLKNFHTTISVIRLNKSIDESIKKHFSLQEDIFTALEIGKKEVNGQEVFDWSEESDETKEKINSSLEELGKSEYEVEYLNRIEEEDFVIMTRGLSNNELSFLYDYLIKK